MSRRKKPRPFSDGSKAFAEGLSLGKKTAYGDIRKFILSESRENLPFDVIQNTLDYIEKFLRYDK